MVACAGQFCNLAPWFCCAWKEVIDILLPTFSLMCYKPIKNIDLVYNYASSVALLPDMRIF